VLLAVLAQRHVRCAPCAELVRSSGVVTLAVSAALGGGAQYSGTVVKASRLLCFLSLELERANWPALRRARAWHAVVAALHSRASAADAYDDEHMADRAAHSGGGGRFESVHDVVQDLLQTAAALAEVYDGDGEVAPSQCTTLAVATRTYASTLLDPDYVSAAAARGGGIA
jgi:hypothetical protein